MEKFFISNARIISEKYKASLAKHQGLAGESREELIKNFIREYIPYQYGITSGEIHSDLGKSNQIDIIIYDATRTNGFSLSEKAKIIPGEHVKAIIEVKSRLSKVKLIEGVKNIRSAIDVIPPHPDLLKRHHKPFTSVFAYELNRNSLSSISKNMNEMLAVNPRTLVNLICVLNDGLVHFNNEYFPYHYVPFYNSTEYIPTPLGERTLHRFSEVLLSHIHVD